MNKRIRKLAEQAGEYVNEVYTPPVRSKEPGKIWEDGHIDWMEQFNEKFAQLIIKECGVALSPMLRDQISRGKAFDLIKQHFGVAE
jgi:hypothetical protein